MIVVYELRDSESGSVDSSSLESGEVWNVTKKYLIGQCPGGMGQVKDEIAPYLPRYWSSPTGYWRRKSMAIKGVGRQCFEVTGEYQTLAPASGGEQDQPDDSREFVPGSLSWDTTGVTEHRTSALEERIIGGDNGDNFYGAINLRGDSIEGIDVVIPGMKYSETWIMPVQVGLSTEYARQVFLLTGTVNAADFRAFSPGEALFLGARANHSGDQPYATVTFDFHIRANNPEFYVKGLEQTSKKGWEHFWVVYRTDTSDSGMLIQYPRCLVINKIYEEEDWSPLRINTAPGRQRRGTATTAAQTAEAVDAFFAR